MTEAIRDQNHRPVWLGTSYIDGITPVPIAIDSATGGMMLDTTHTIQFTPSADLDAIRDQNHVPVLMGASSVDGTPFPVLVDPVTGGVLVDIT